MALPSLMTFGHTSGWSRLDGADKGAPGPGPPSPPRQGHDITAEDEAPESPREKEHLMHRTAMTLTTLAEVCVRFGVTVLSGRRNRHHRRRSATPRPPRLDWEPTWAEVDDQPPGYW